MIKCFSPVRIGLNIIGLVRVGAIKFIFFGLGPGRSTKNLAPQDSSIDYSPPLVNIFLAIIDFFLADVKELGNVFQLSLNGDGTSQTITYEIKDCIRLLDINNHGNNEEASMSSSMDTWSWWWKKLSPLMYDGAEGTVTDDQVERICVLVSWSYLAKKVAQVEFCSTQKEAQWRNGHKGWLHLSTGSLNLSMVASFHPNEMGSCLDTGIQVLGMRYILRSSQWFWQHISMTWIRIYLQEGLFLLLWKPHRDLAIHSKGTNSCKF